MNDVYEHVIVQNDEGYYYQRKDMDKDRILHIFLKYETLKNIILKLKKGYNSTDLFLEFGDKDDNCEIAGTHVSEYIKDDKTNLAEFFTKHLIKCYPEISTETKAIAKKAGEVQNKFKLLSKYISDNWFVFCNEHEFIDYDKLKITPEINSFINSFKEIFDEYCHNHDVSIDWITLQRFYMHPVNIPRVTFNSFQKFLSDPQKNGYLLFDFLIEYNADLFYTRRMIDTIINKVGSTPDKIQNEFINMEKENDYLRYIWFEDEFGISLEKVLNFVFDNIIQHFNPETLFGDYVDCYKLLIDFNENIKERFDIYLSEGV